MVISTWATKALEDGKISAAEGLELIGELALILGVPLELDVSREAAETIKEIIPASQPEEQKPFLSSPDFVSPD